MILLDATTKTLEVDLDAAVTTNQLPVVASYTDLNQTTAAWDGAESSDTQTNSTTAVTILSAPAASTTRKLQSLTVYNADTVAADVTIQLNNNGTLRILVKESLKPGETLQYADGEGFSVVNKKKITEAFTSTSTSNITGDWIEDDNTELALSGYSTEAGTLYVDYSNDGGTTTHSTYPVLGYPAVQGGDGNYRIAHVAKKMGRAWRVRYTHGSTPSTFSLAVFSGNSLGPLYTTLSNSISEHNDAQLVRNISGFNDDSKFGRVEDLDAADAATDVWAMGDDTFANYLATKTFPTSANTLYIASDNSGDTSLYVTVVYIDSNGYLQEVEVQLDASDAQTAVSTGISGLDCNRAYLSGDDESAAGNIYVANNASFTSGVPSTLSNTLCMIPAGYGQSQQCMDRVPTGKKLWIKRLVIKISRASGAAGSANVYLRIKPAGGSWRIFRDFAVTDGEGINKEAAGLRFDEGTIVVMRVESVSDTDTTIFAEYHYEYLDAVL